MSARYTITLARIFLAFAALAAVLLARSSIREVYSAEALATPSLVVSPTTAGPNDKVTLRGSGWPANAQLSSRFYEASAVGGPGADMGPAIQVDSTGSFTSQATVPNTLFGQGSRGNLNVVPGSYTIVVSVAGGPSASIPFTVGAPSQGALLWGQVYFDTNNSGTIDAGDIPAGGLIGVNITPQTSGGPAPGRPSMQAITDAKGRYVVYPIPVGSYNLNASAQRFSNDWAGTTSASVESGQAVQADILLRPAPPSVAPERYFKETGFAIDNDDFWNYFTHRGGIRTLGYPISRTFIFQGYPTQFFQRIILQDVPGQGIQRLNLLDPGLMPYTHINGSQFPAVDPAVKAQTPVVGSADYADRVIAFVEQHAPNEIAGKRVGFWDAFIGTVTAADAFPAGDHEELVPLLNLEIWGTPTSNPTPDPTNSNFIYLRFQRGILHFQGYDASGNPITEGILLGDWFKSLITGRNLPPDLEAQAKADNSPYLRQYDPSKPGWIADPSRLLNTDFTLAFEKE